MLDYKSAVAATSEVCLSLRLHGIAGRCLCGASHMLSQGVALEADGSW